MGLDVRHMRSQQADGRPQAMDVRNLLRKFESHSVRQPTARFVFSGRTHWQLAEMEVGRPQGISIAPPKAGHGIDCAW
jgi:hypothetical protein